MLSQVGLEQVDARQVEVQIGFDLADKHFVRLHNHLNVFDAKAAVLLLHGFQNLVSTFERSQHVVGKGLRDHLDHAVFGL